MARFRHILSTQYFSPFLFLTILSTHYSQHLLFAIFINLSRFRHNYTIITFYHFFIQNDDLDTLLLTRTFLLIYLLIHGLDTLLSTIITIQSITEINKISTQYYKNNILRFSFISTISTHNLLSFYSSFFPTAFLYKYFY